MVQCKTTNMTEILQADLETDVCDFVPVYSPQSQPACPLLPLIGSSFVSLHLPLMVKLLWDEALWE